MSEIIQKLVSKEITDFHCLESFCSGVEAMDKFIQGDFRMITVEALATSEYSAVGFYQRCGFTANEVRKPYKDTLRMFRTLYANEEEYADEL